MSQKTTLLTVDDDVDFLDGLVDLLKMKNYTVITAIDGEDAVQKYHEVQPDFVLMDVNMPKLNGYEAFFKIKNKDKDAKVILMSGYGLTERYSEAKKKCLIYCVPKPFSISFLDELIQQNISRNPCIDDEGHLK